MCETSNRPTAVAGRAVLVEDAGRVLHRHRPAAEVDHLRADAPVRLVKRRLSGCGRRGRGTGGHRGAHPARNAHQFQGCQFAPAVRSRLLRCWVFRRQILEKDPQKLTNNEPRERIRKHVRRYKEIVERWNTASGRGGKKREEPAGRRGLNSRAEERATGIENAREQTGSEKPDRSRRDKTDEEVRDPIPGGDRDRGDERMRGGRTGTGGGVRGAG